MSKDIAMLSGGCAGAVLWLVLRGPLTSGLFVSAVCSSLFAVGLRAVLMADIEIGGRGGASPRTFVGLSARLIGALIATVAGGVVFLALQGP